MLTLNKGHPNEPLTLTFTPSAQLKQAGIMRKPMSSSTSGHGTPKQLSIPTGPQLRV